jgi:hypothetical protein
MGTKIYMGFRLGTDRFSEALKIINGFRPWVNGQAEALVDAFIEKAEATRTDPAADAFNLWLDLREKLVRGKRHRVPAVDTDFSVTLIPAQDCVLGIAYTVHREWYDAWCRHPGVEEYSFFDTGDQPEELTEAEWAARSEAWSVVTRDVVCVQGFSIDLVDPAGPMPKKYRCL